MEQRMNKEEFLRELGSLLSDIPEKDREDAIKYYSDYIDDAGEEAEHAIAELGSPESVARIVKSESADALEPRPIENPPVEQPGNLNAAPSKLTQGDKAKKRLPAWAIVVLTLLSPVILALGLAAVILVLTVVLVALAVVFAVTAVFLLLAYVAGLSVAAGGFMISEGCIAAGFVTFGTGLFLFAAALIVLIAAGFGFVKFLPWLFRLLFSTKKQRIARKEAKRNRREAKNAGKAAVPQPEPEAEKQEPAPEQPAEQPVQAAEQQGSAIEQQEPVSEQPEQAAEQQEPATEQPTEKTSGSFEQGVE